MAKYNKDKLQTNLIKRKKSNNTMLHTKESVEGISVRDVKMWNVLAMTLQSYWNSNSIKIGMTQIWHLVHCNLNDMSISKTINNISLQTFSMRTTRGYSWQVYSLISCFMHDPWQINKMTCRNMYSLVSSVFLGVSTLIALRNKKWDTKNALHTPFRRHCLPLTSPVDDVTDPWPSALGIY